MTAQSGKSCAKAAKKPMAKLFRRDGERARAADLAAGLDALQPRQHALGEQRHVAFGHVVRHAAVAERTDQAAAVGKAGARRAC